MIVSFKRNRGSTAGCAAFTLSEVMVAVALFAFLSFSGYLTLAMGFRVVQSAQEDLRATQILQDKTEIVRLYTWDQLTNSSFMPLSFTEYFNPGGQSGTAYYGSVSVANSSATEKYGGDLKMVTFQLNWTNSSAPQQRQITTLVSRYGLHNYIYGSP